VRPRDTDRGYHARRAWECCEGNVLDLAIAVVVGAAFTRIVDSLVGDIIMPFIGAMTGGVDNYFLPLSKAVTATSLAEAKKQGAV
jgi:large conductance mechanosensitive channel